MNENIDTDPRVELAALRQRLDRLEAEHRLLQHQASQARRPAFFRGLLLSALSVLLLLTAGALWGQQVMSLFIDSNGNVGIGTTSPVARLDIQQKPRTNPQNHVAPSARVLYVTGDLGSASGIEFRNSSGTQGIGFGFNSIYATGSQPDQDLWINPRGTGGKVKITRLESNGDANINGKLTMNSAAITGNASMGSATIAGNLMFNNMSPLAGSENLRIVRGTINPSGEIKAGSGFKVSKGGTGVYDIEFLPQFAGQPSASVSQIYPDPTSFQGVGDTRDNAKLGGLTLLKMRVVTGKPDGGTIDRWFSFVVIGPR